MLSSFRLMVWYLPMTDIDLPALDRELKKGAAELLLLSVLEARPRHGYELGKLIETQSGGRLVFHLDSLYPLLYRLEAFVLAESVETHGSRLWVLGNDLYHGHGAVPALRSTNIPGYDQTVSWVGFDASLGRAWYVSRKSGESVSVRRFKADTLAAAATRRRAAHERPRNAVAVGWRLRPFWRFP